MPRLEEMLCLPDGEYGPGYPPAPVVTSEVVSELVLSLGQLLGLLAQSKYGKVLPPGNIEVRPIFHSGDFCGVKYVWRVPTNSPESGTKIKVNGRERIVTVDELSYEDVVRMALVDRPEPPNPLPMLTVVFNDKANGSRVSGTLTKGQSVKVFPGMNFDACDTSNA